MDSLPVNSDEITGEQHGFDFLAELLRDRRELIIAGHRNADGDCLGSMSAFYSLRRKMHFESTLLTADPVPSNFAFLPGMDSVRVCDSFDCAGRPLLLLECGTPERSGIQLSNYAETVNLDHHPGNSFYGTVNIVDNTASSIGEIITAFLRCRFSEEISPEIAAALFTAIHTDTGGFSYGNTTETALFAAAFLVGKGAEAGRICEAVYQENRLERYRLLGHFLSGIRLHESGRIASGLIRLNDLKSYNCSPEDTDNFSGYPRGIRGVKAAVFMMEIAPSVYKVSLRSKGEWSINKTATKMGGGGHRAAAGFVRKGEAGCLLSEIVRFIREENEESNLSD
ncbi:MAG: hypothetical protein GXO69_07370 [Acidobacteria bacterium]|nr:hypothetical protein [Acidobacteriota bacterium]